MKAVSDIQNELKELLNEFSNQCQFKDSEIKKARKKADLLTKCLYYLQTNPLELGMKDQVKFLETRLKAIDNGFQSWLDIQPNVHELKNPLSKYHADMRYNELKFQLKTLNYLLS